VATLRRLAEPADAARELVRLANEGGGRDNITAVVVDVVGLGPAADGAEPSPADTTAPHAPVGEASVFADDEAPRSSRATAVEEDEPRVRRFTWRVAVFVLALLLLVGVVVGALGWYARETYFVALDDEQVVIFKGRPGGFLWFDPTVEQRTDIALQDVPDAELADLEEGVDQATLADAERYVENLHGQIDQLSTGDRPTTSTTVPDDDRGGADGGGGGDDGTTSTGNN
jgi:protein phosphatase